MIITRSNDEISGVSRDQNSSAVDFDRLRFHSMATHRAAVDTLQQNHISRTRQPTAACTGYSLDRFTIVFIAPTTLLSNHELADTGILRYPGPARPQGVFSCSGCYVRLGFRHNHCRLTVLSLWNSTAATQ